METWASQAMGNAPIRVDNGMDTHAAYKHAKKTLDEWRGISCWVLRRMFVQTMIKFSL